ncbi:MAG: hypothetical protein AB7F75_12390 [Planctomycetota bacterium]
MTQDEQDKITWLTRGLEILSLHPQPRASRELLLRVLGAGSLEWIEGHPGPLPQTLDVRLTRGILRLHQLRPGSHLETASPAFLEALAPLADKALDLV